MKKLVLCGVFIFLFVMGSDRTFASGDLADLSNAQIGITDASSIKLTGMQVEGWPGTYWAEFAWDSQLMKFSLKASGADAVPETFDGCGGTIAITNSTIATNGNSAYVLRLTPDPANRKIYISAQQSLGYPIVCISSGIITQTTETFQLLYNGQGTLYLDGSWTGCDTVNPGQTMTGFISVPEWFSFTKAYTITISTAYGETPSGFTCTP